MELKFVKRLDFSAQLISLLIAGLFFFLSEYAILNPQYNISLYILVFFGLLQLISFLFHQNKEFKNKAKKARGIYFVFLCLHILAILLGLFFYSSNETYFILVLYYLLLSGCFLALLYLFITAYEYLYYEN